MLSTDIVEQCAFVCEKLFLSWWTQERIVYVIDVKYLSEIS